MRQEAAELALWLIDKHRYRSLYADLPAKQVTGEIQDLLYLMDLAEALALAVSRGIARG